MIVLGSFILSYEQIPQAQKAQKVLKQIKTKTVLNAHKNI